MLPTTFTFMFFQRFYIFWYVFPTFLYFLVSLHFTLVLLLPKRFSAIFNAIY